jgi:hypothetical protein
MLKTSIYRSLEGNEKNGLWTISASLIQQIISTNLINIKFQIKEIWQLQGLRKAFQIF